MENLTREKALEIVTALLDDMVSGPDTQTVLTALGLTRRISRLPKKAVLDLEAERLFIDGAEFPWYITEDGVEVNSLLDRNAIPTISFAMFAETVEIIPKEPEDTATTTTEK